MPSRHASNVDLPTALPALPPSALIDLASALPPSPMRTVWPQTVLVGLGCTPKRSGPRPSIAVRSVKRGVVGFAARPDASGTDHRLVSQILLSADSSAKLQAASAWCWRWARLARREHCGRDGPQADLLLSRVVAAIIVVSGFRLTTRHPEAQGIVDSFNSAARLQISDTFAVFWKPQKYASTRRKSQWGFL